MLYLFIRKDKIQTAWLYFLPSLTERKKKKALQDVVNE